MDLIQSNFGIDIQNKAASISFYKQTNQPGTLPGVNINVKLNEELDTKSVEEVKQLASREAIKLLEEVITLLRSRLPR